MRAFPPPELRAIRRASGRRATAGLGDGTLHGFWDRDPSLRRAVAEAAAAHSRIRDLDPVLAALPEEELCEALQRDVLSFYGADAASPYVPLAASGPWIVTFHGAVLHDSAGYGMLGLGHGPESVMETLREPWVMANVMTPSWSQRRFTSRLRREIGRTRDGCPYDRFMFLNSGSESVSLAGRIADLNAFRETASGGRHAGAAMRLLSLEGSFHGRTERAARASDLTRDTYRRHLASFRDRDPLDTVRANDLDGLRDAFARADEEGIFYEAVFLEPVLGEGEPGLAITPEFYAAARELSAERGTILIVDSIQAGLRAQGCLSIVDYPGFRDLPPPDMETYSKALNAGQYPLSVLALTAFSAGLYMKGVYGNTMTANPRALEVGCAVLDSITDDLRRNIVERGKELAAGLERIASEIPETITGVSGTGLLVCAEIDPDLCEVTGPGGLEERLRKRGIAMIHGGRNGLRFTPHFAITSEEIALILENVRAVLKPVGDPVTRRAQAELRLATPAR